MVLGQGAWIEADCLSINPDLNIGFNGYPVTEDASQCQVISGSDQALHVNKDSKVLQQTLDFLTGGIHLIMGNHGLRMLPV